MKPKIRSRKKASSKRNSKTIICNLTKEEIRKQARELMQKNDMKFRYNQLGLLVDTLTRPINSSSIEAELWLHKNGYGKTTVSTLAFKFANNAILTSLSHEHINEKLRKDLQRKWGMKEFSRETLKGEGKADYIYFRPFDWFDFKKNNGKRIVKEWMCDATKKCFEDGGEIQATKKELRDAGIEADFIHDFIHQHYPEFPKDSCFYIKQKDAMSDSEGNQKILCTIEMLIGKFVEQSKYYPLVIIDEGDGIFGKKEEIGISEELYNALSQHSKDVEYSGEPHKLFGNKSQRGLVWWESKVKQLRFPKDELDEECERLKKEIKDKVNKNQEVEDELFSKFKHKSRLREYQEQGFVFDLQEIKKEMKGKDIEKKTRIIYKIIDVPLLYKLFQGFLISKYNLQRDIRLVLTFARMRNDSLKLDLWKANVDLLYKINPQIYFRKDGNIAGLTYHQEKRWSSVSEPILISPPEPTNSWNFTIVRFNQKMSHTYMVKKLCKRKDNRKGGKLLNIRKFADYIIELEPVMRKIMGKYHDEKAHGVIITFKEFRDTFQELRNMALNDEKRLNQLLKGYNPEKRKRFKDILKQAKYERVRWYHFGNTTAGIEIPENTRFLIMLGNWITGEIDASFDGLYYQFYESEYMKIKRGKSKMKKQSLPFRPESIRKKLGTNSKILRLDSFISTEEGNNYRYSVIPEAPIELKEYIFAPFIKENMEYVARTRRDPDKDVYAITDLFSSRDEELQRITDNIIQRDYNAHYEVIE